MRLTTWLKDKDPDVWFMVTDYINWDNGRSIIKWIVQQPQCDKANAAKIFWSADPGFIAEKLASGEGVPAWAVDGWGPGEIVLMNWRRGFYQRSELAWPDEGGQASISHYQRTVARTPGADRALDLPADLFGPFPGRVPRIPPELTPEENAELWDMLKRQGTFAGPRPGSDQWKAEREKAARPTEKPRFWEKLFR